MAADEYTEEQREADRVKLAEARARQNLGITSENKSLPTKCENDGSSPATSETFPSAPNGKCRRCQSLLPEDRNFLCVSCEERVAGESSAMEARRLDGMIDGLLRRSGLPAVYRSGKRDLESVRYAEAVSAIYDSLTGDTPGVYVHGTAGEDKSTLVCSALAMWIRSSTIEVPRSGVYVNCLDLITDIQATYRPGAELTRADIVTRLIDAQALVLDDLGKEKASDHAAGVIYQVLDGRYRQHVDGVNRPLWIASNYSLDEICARFYDPNTAEPIRRRIVEMTVRVDVSAVTA